MNEIKILNHTINWFLRENSCQLLNPLWEENITNFILNSYLEGEFSVEFNNFMDSLIWKIKS